MSDFFLLGVHIKPDDAYNEINHLPLAFDDAKTAFGTDRGILMGDFNAGCTYLSNTQYRSLALVTDSRFSWLIASGVDTTTGPSVCTYDRQGGGGGVSGWGEWVGEGWGKVGGVRGGVRWVGGGWGEWVGSNVDTTTGPLISLLVSWSLGPLVHSPLTKHEHLLTIVTSFLSQVLKHNVQRCTDNMQG